MNDFPQYNLWRENFLFNLREISSEDEFKKLALCYPDNNYNENKCRQRKNNLLRNGNRNIYLDDLYAVSCYSKKSPNSLLLGQNNILSFWSELEGENLFEKQTIEKIKSSIKKDKNYRNIFIPREIEDFLYYAKATIYNVNKKKMSKSIFTLSDNSLDFKTIGKNRYSYNLNLFNGSFVYDVFCDYILDLEFEAFKECEKETFEAFKNLVDIYLDCGGCDVDGNSVETDSRIKSWVSNCTMWLVLSFIGDTCQRLDEDIETYLDNNREIILFMYDMFVFGTRVVKQKRVTDEVTSEKKRIRYFAFLDCNGEKLDRAEDEYDYDDIDYKTASFSDMQKSSLSDILNFELR